LSLGYPLGAPSSKDCGILIWEDGVGGWGGVGGGGEGGGRQKGVKETGLAFIFFHSKEK